MNNMQKCQIDLYKKELSIAVIAALVSVLLVAFSYNSKSNSFQRYEQLSNEKAGLKNEVNYLVEAKSLLANIGTRFEDIKVQGFYADEDRLPWVEVLKVVSERLKLPNLKYSISPQEKIPEISDSSFPGLVLSQSIMSIDADLLHEGDLLNISEALSKQPGLFSVQGCELNKTEGTSVRKIQRNMVFKCSLAWYTVKYTPDETMVDEDLELDMDMDI